MARFALSFAAFRRARPWHLASLPALLALVSGCGPMVVDARGYATSIDQAGSPAFRIAEPGAELALGGADCAVFGASLSALEAGNLHALPNAPTAIHLARVVSSVAVLGESGGSGFLAFALSGVDQGSSWMRLEGGKPVHCARPASEAIQKAVAQKGRTVTFTPWAPSCARIEATGTTPDSTLLENEPGATFEVGAAVLGPATATVQGDSGEPWLDLARGTLKVRLDTLLGCFTDVNPELKPLPPSAGALVHTDLGRCRRSEDEGKDHVECRTSVGVWEGVASSSAVSLRLVRRTLGPLHFLGGRPVDGRRWARALVAVQLGARVDQRVHALYDAMERSVSTALASDDGSVRVVPVNDPDVGYRLTVDVADASIGDLEQHVEDATSQYEDHKEERPNPDKEKARQEVEDDEQKLRDAEQKYQSDVERAQQLREACLSACASVNDVNQRNVCEAGCKIGGAIVAPSHDGVESAESDLSEARSRYADTPNTIMVPIMATWSYKKKTYARSASATLRVRLAPKEGEPTSLVIPLAYTWRDYEQEGDARHAVDAHSPDSGPIERADAVVPYLADRALKELGQRLRATLSRATLEEAKRALAQAGQPTKPGFEAVDAIAYDVAGARLVKAELRGTATVPGGGSPFELPSAALKLGHDECLLAVAASDDDSGATFTLESEDHAFGDLRNRSYAVVEACGAELARPDAPIALRLASGSGGRARWTLYRTHASARQEEAKR